MLVLMVMRWSPASARRALGSASHLGGTSWNASPRLPALLLGALTNLFPAGMAWLRPGEVLTRHVVATGQVLTSALLIHLSGGRIETHFHVFGSLAFISFYRDWKVLIPATVYVAADHFLRGVYFPQSVRHHHARALALGGACVVGALRGFLPVHRDPQCRRSDGRGGGSTSAPGAVRGADGARGAGENPRAGSRQRRGGGSHPREGGFSREHVARDPHADERDHRNDRSPARDAAGRAAERLHRDPARKRRASIDPGQRDPRFLEDRGRQARARPRAVRSAPVRGRGAGIGGRARPDERAGADLRVRSADPPPLHRRCEPIETGAREPAQQRRQVHRSGRSRDGDRSALRAGDADGEYEVGSPCKTSVLA